MNQARVGRATLLDPDVARAISQAPPGRQRRIAVAVAALALGDLPSRPVELDEALEEVRVGVFASDTRELVTTAAERLDEEYLDLFDDEKEGGRSDGWEAAFRLARAAASLRFAFEDDPEVAATEATYEALHCLNDISVKAVVLATA